MSLKGENNNNQKERKKKKRSFLSSLKICLNRMVFSKFKLAKLKWRYTHLHFHSAYKDSIYSLEFNSGYANPTPCFHYMHLQENFKKIIQTSSQGSRGVWGNIYNASCSQHENSTLLPIDNFYMQSTFACKNRHAEEILHPYQSSLNDEAHVFV